MAQETESKFNPITRQFFGSDTRNQDGVMSADRNSFTQKNRAEAGKAFEIMSLIRSQPAAIRGYAQTSGGITGQMPNIILPGKDTAPRAGIWQSALRGIKFASIVAVGAFILAATAKYFLGFPVPLLP